MFIDPSLGKCIYKPANPIDEYICTNFLYFLCFSFCSGRLYRLLAYQSYTYWVHRRLGKSVRKVVPACVVNAIRANWPEANPNNYVSYKDPDDDELIDAWAI